MKTDFRNNQLSKQRMMVLMTLCWAVSATLGVVFLGSLCLYLAKTQQTHWLPVCTESELTLGASSYSPSYMKEMAKKIMNLRLTYNPETVEGRFASLAYLIPAKEQQAFKKLLDEEALSIKENEISSVFYEENFAPDLKLNQAKIDGELHRAKHGVWLEPKKARYLIQFSFNQGQLWPQSIKELDDVQSN
jgi:conjugal transfer pilus assembly protein TraE